MNSSQRPRKKRTGLKIILILIVILILFRIALPYIVLDYVNKTLSKSKEYYGRVQDIDIALIRGAYVIKDIKIEKINSETRQNDTIPFFTSPEIDLSVEWNAILKGALVGEIEVENPVLNFVKGKHKNEDAKADTADFRRTIRDLMPLKVNRFEINNGQIHYIDKNKKPLVDVALKDLHVLASNLSNANDSNKLLPSTIKATGNAYEGKFELNVELDALNKVPTFDMNTRVTGVNMVLLNSFFKAYGNFDLTKGNFGMYTEFAAKEGKFKGYVKPIIKDLDIVQWNKEEGNAGQILWETLVGSVAEIFQNQRKEQLATKVPIEGKFDNPNANLWDAITYVLRNAFVYALKPSIDNTINIGEVEAVEVAEQEKKKNFFQKIFGGKKDKNKKEEKQEKEKER